MVRSGYVNLHGVEHKISIKNFYTAIRPIPFPLYS